MKWLLYVLMLGLLASVAAAGNYGSCKYGVGAYGIGENCGSAPPAVPPTAGGGGGTGPICPNGTFEFLGSCLNAEFTTLFSNFTLNLFNSWFNPTQNGVLEYRLLTPTEAKPGATIQVLNLFANEGTQRVELHCTNFIDTNRNGKMDPGEPQESFSKEAEPSVENSMQAQLMIPADTELGNYLVGGVCKLGNGEPDATAGNKLLITTPEERVEQQIETKSYNRQILWMVLLFIGMLVAYRTGLISVLVAYIGALGPIGYIAVVVLGMLVYAYFKWFR